MTYYVVREPNEQVKDGDPVGFRLRHNTVTFGMVLVPCTWIKYPEPMACPTCRVLHPVKTIHLHIEPDGTVIVSKGVLERLQKAGMGFYGLTLEGAIKNPPPLNVSRGATRESINQDNRAIRLLGKS